MQEYVKCIYRTCTLGDSSSLHRHIINVAAPLHGAHKPRPLQREQDVRHFQISIQISI